jgi:hypothetical protein
VDGVNFNDKKRAGSSFLFFLKQYSQQGECTYLLFQPLNVKNIICMGTEQSKILNLFIKVTGMRGQGNQ